MTIKKLIQMNNLFPKKLFFIKKFCLIYLMRMQKPILLKKKNFNYLDVLKKDSSKKNFFKKIKKISLIENEFIKFSLFFQKLTSFLFDYPKIHTRKFEPISGMHNINHKSIFVPKKKPIYFIKNFRKSKNKNFLWFLEYTKNRYIRRVQKINRNSCLFNPKILLDMVIKESKKNSIKGFSKKALDFIFKILKIKIKTIILEIVKISMKKRLFKNQIIKDWGNNNLIFKKIKTYLDFKFNYKFRNRIKFSIRKFKVKKKILENVIKNENLNKNLLIQTTNYIDEEKKNQHTEDILSKANKTLLTLLSEILTGRIEELGKATYCLCQYKPSEIRYFEKEEKNFPDIKKNQKPIKKSVNTYTKNRYEIQKRFFKSKWYISANDCFSFLKKDPVFRNKEFPVALFIILMEDFNMRFQRTSD